MSSTSAPNEIRVAAGGPEHTAAAAELAESLALPLDSVAGEAGRLLLVVTADRLELRLTGPGAPGPVYVDFLAGKADFRRRYGSSRDEGVIRAVASKRNRTPTVLDATGGLGRDAFVLAGHGCRVLLVERHPVLAALLADGLRRGKLDEKVARIVTENLRLLPGDSREIMGKLPEAERPEVIYLDPMYPHRDKSALAKKEMVVLRRLVGPDLDSAGLLTVARVCARQRVVVKRPAAAEPLAGLPADSVLRSGAHRFDIYFTGGGDRQLAAA